MIEVHLPVATHQRSPVSWVAHESARTRPPCRGALTADRSAASPTRSPCSSSSSDAPPPVEMKSIWSARPSSSTALALSPPPTTVKPGQAATALATPLVPSTNRGSSNTPMGPFHRTVPAEAMACANSFTDSGPMSRPCQSSGTSLPTIRTSPPPACHSGPKGAPAPRPGARPRPPGLRAPRGARGPGPHVAGEEDPFAGGQEPGAVVELVHIYERASDVVTGGGQEGEGHAPAHDQRVDP